MSRLILAMMTLSVADARRAQTTIGTHPTPQMALCTTYLASALD